MKKITIIAFSIALGITPSVHAEYFAKDPHSLGIAKVSEENLTLTLTKSISTPALDLKDETGKVVSPKELTDSNWYTDTSGNEIYEEKTTLVKTKYSNAEFIKDLKALEVITDVAGWSVVFLQDNDYMRQYTETYDETFDFSPIYGVYLKKKSGTTFVLKDVSEYLSYEPYGYESGPDYYLHSFVEAYNYLESNNYDNIAAPVHSYKETSSSFGKGSVTLFPMSDNIGLNGICTTSNTWDSANEHYKETTTINNLIGLANGENGSVVYDGTVSATFAAFGPTATYRTWIPAPINPAPSN